MKTPEEAAQRSDVQTKGAFSSLSSASTSSHTHNLLDRPPSLLPAAPTERSVPTHTNLETAVHADGPPEWPVITYKHVLSAGTLLPTNPLRVIAHCDVDAAYAQFEASRLGLDATVVPIAVQQWSGLIAVNYPARDAGVSRFESIIEAVKKCPDLHLVHVATYAHGSDKAEYHDEPKPETHKVSLDPYRRESNKILAIFKSTCPSGAVEKASIDESYFDLTIEVRKLMIERFPYLKNVPSDNAESGIKGMDCPLPPPPRLGLKQWKQLGYVVPKSGDVGRATGIGRPEKAVAKGALLVDAPIGAGIVSPMPPSGDSIDVNETLEVAPHASWGSEDRLTDPTSSQQADLEAEEALWDRIEFGDTTWTDIALALGAELMNRVRQNVLDQLGYTTSAGIASNKTLSKLCSSWRKPNGQTIMRPNSVPNFFSSLPFQKIRFLGGKLGTAIGQEWNSATVADLWSVSLDEMQAKFGEEARWVFNVLRGVDHSEVRERVNNQTMLASKSVRPAITKPEEAMHWLGILATELAIRLLEARKDRTNLWPKTLVLRYIRAGSVPRSRQAAFPFSNPNAQDELARAILKKGERLWQDSIGDALGTHSGGRTDGGKVLTIALGFSGLEEGEVGQRGIQGFLGAPTPTSRQLSPNALSEKSKTPESTAAEQDGEPEKSRKKPRLNNLFDQQRNDNVKRNDHDSLKLEILRPQDEISESSSTVNIPSTSLLSEASAELKQSEQILVASAIPSWQCPKCGQKLQPSPSILAFEQPYVLEKLKEEHQDWHFAVSLSQAAGPSPTASATAPQKAAKKKAVAPPPKGLDKFFVKKS